MTGVANLYAHFPFCRRKCAYCALYSRPGAGEGERRDYVEDLARAIAALAAAGRLAKPLSTIYFGGGSPALCSLEPLFAALAPFLAPETEFTVELHPLDVSPALLDTLASGGVNRISMGVQSLDDAVLRAMGRGYSAAEAEKAFSLVRSRFENAGIDLISGWPGDNSGYSRLSSWGLAHCSAYSLMLESGTALAALVERGRITLPDDDALLDRLAALRDTLSGMGLERYEISNYSRPGRECRHNLAVWRGEDYFGIGDGACGRIGLERTRNGAVDETLSPEKDRLERTLFRLRTREGLDASLYPAWREQLDGFVASGLLAGAFPVYRLTRRGAEVCDSILADLVCQ